MSVTIRDVAKHAGVSIATVSRVINKNGYVNKETEQQVKKSIKELNYKPNAVARSLFKKKSKSIGLIIPDITNPFFPELARAVEDVANKNDYTLLLYNSDEDPRKEKKYLEDAKQKYIDGIILATNSLSKEELHHYGFPKVALDRCFEDNIPTVTSKNFQGGRLATQYLKSIGCKTIAHIKGPENNINAINRYKGYLEEVKNEDWFYPEIIALGDYQMKRATEVTKELLMKNPRIDGIFAGNDIMAIGAMKAAQQLGRKVPDDLSIIGFDGIALGEMMIPELTTVAQPIYQMGEIATNMLIELIEGKPINKKTYELDVQLLKRNSTK